MGGKRIISINVNLNLLRSGDPALRTAHLIYFSPTGTTRTTIAAIARGLEAKKIIHYDGTLPNVHLETVLTDGVAIIGAPVYAGRMPELCLQRLQAITAKHLPCVLVALYGNRAYEDALVELRDFAVSKGFNVVAAGAFIGEHSYSTPHCPIAAGRPDAEDLALAERFGRQVAAKIENGCFDPPEIKGDVPYREGVQFGGTAPESDRGRCILCGRCAEVCPTGAIQLSDRVITEAGMCVMCCACVKTCAVNARSFNHPRVAERRALLLQYCSEAKAPELFL